MIIDIWDRAKNVMVAPNIFFKKIFNEEGYKKQIVFMIAFVIIIFSFVTYKYLNLFNTTIITYYNIMFSMVNNHFNQTILPELYPIQITVTIYIIFYFLSGIMFIIFSFLRYWITHWYVILVGGKKGYHQTLKAMIYTLTPEYITGPVSLIILLIPFIVQEKGMFFWLIWLFFFIILNVFGLYQVYLRTIGLSKLQKISYLNAFLVIYVYGTITMTIIFILVYAFIIGLLISMIVYLG